MTRSLIKEFLGFAKKGIFLSLLLAGAVTAIAFKQILLIRFVYGFVSEAALASPKMQALLLNGLNSNLLSRFSVYGPRVLIVILAILGLYLMALCFKNTYLMLAVRTEYINNQDNKNAVLEYLGYTGMHMLAVTIPIIYWTLFVAYISPYVLKLSVAAILKPQTIVTYLIYVGSFILLVGFAQLGVICSRLAFRYIRWE